MKSANLNPRRLITGKLRATRALDAALTFVLDRERMDRQERRLIIRGTPDQRLRGLIYNLSPVSADVDACTNPVNADALEEITNNLRWQLGELAAYALIWATAGHRNYVRGVQAIVDERQRQRELLAAGRIVDDCASPATDPGAKFRVLFEECGEVAHAIDQVQHHGLAATNIATELTQVAAVCVAWLESLQPQKGAQR